jgi:hypothetical protein
MESAKVLAVYRLSPPLLVVEAEDGAVVAVPQGASRRRPPHE